MYCRKRKILTYEDKDRNKSLAGTVGKGRHLPTRMGQEQESLTGIVGKGRNLQQDMAGTRAPGWYSRERKKPTAGYGRNKSPWLV